MVSIDMASRCRVKIWLFFTLLISIYSANSTAVPACDTIFTNPPSGNITPGLVLPPGILTSPTLGNLICNNVSCNGGSNQFAPGDFDYNVGDFESGAVITTTGRTTRLYFKSLSLTNVKLNLNGKPENLVIYVAGTLTIAGQNALNAVIYVAKDVNIAGQASISGAVAAGGALDVSGNGQVNFDPNAVDNADFNGMCSNSSLQCFTDDFSRTSLGNDWATKVLGSSTPPSIVNNRLRITPATGNQATASTFQRIFPAKDNLVTVEFDYYAWSSSSGT
ncbi:MAG: hypothetical protein ACRDAP_18035, partial [Shewanella sp.]